MTDAKICGLTLPEDARLAAEEGARYLGVILAPGSPRSLTPERAAAVLDGMAPVRVGVFVDAEPEAIRSAVRTVALGVVQLHGDEKPEAAKALRDELGIQVWKAIRVRTSADVLEAVERYAGAVDGLLLDGWSAAARGGTGTTFPWKEVAGVRDRIPDELTLVVAGGLRPERVSRAVGLLRPQVVDVSSGVEAAPGRKDPDLVRRFVAAARSIR